MYTHIYIHTYILISLYLFICLYVCVCVCSHKFILMPPIPVKYHRASLHHFLICNFLSEYEKLALMICNLFIYLVSSNIHSVSEVLTPTPASNNFTN